MLFSENINLFNHCRAHDRNRQTGRITVATPRYAL